MRTVRLGVAAVFQRGGPAYECNGTGRAGSWGNAPPGDRPDGSFYSSSRSVREQADALEDIHEARQIRDAEKRSRGDGIIA
jgi:hypothetical protein